MSSIARAFDDAFEADFTPYRRSRKRPTKASIERLTDEYGQPEPTDDRRIHYYLVEVQLGTITDAFASPTTFPAAKKIYLSRGGQLNSALIGATVQDGGSLEPKGKLEPVVCRPWIEGRKATQEEWNQYGPVLRDAHGLFLDSNVE